MSAPTGDPSRIYARARQVLLELQHEIQFLEAGYASPDRKNEAAQKLNRLLHETTALENAIENRSGARSARWRQCVSMASLNVSADYGAR